MTADATSRVFASIRLNASSNNSSPRLRPRKFLLTGQCPQQSRWHVWIARQLLRHLIGQVAKVDDVSRKRVETGDAPSIRSDDKNCRNILPDILTSLFLQISV